MRPQIALLLPLLCVGFSSLAEAESLDHQDVTSAPPHQDVTPAPPGALADCRGKAAGQRIMHQTPEGSVAAICQETPAGLIARPEARGRGMAPRQPTQALYTMEQATSDQAQMTTIAFNALAFISGNRGASTFIPPGKVADFFGFQALRDRDPASQGHSPQFLDRAAGIVLSNLDASQKEMLRAEAGIEADRLHQLAMRRLPLINAFHDQLQGQLPPGSSGLNQDAIRRYTADLFAEDANLAYQRAELFGRLAASLTPQQRGILRQSHGTGFNSWPSIRPEDIRLERGAKPLDNIAYMTLASEFFSWYAGSTEADSYFCPERHGTYFGGFYLKDAPAMAAAAAGRRDYQISTSLTGTSGEAFLRLLSPNQRRMMTDILDHQRQSLAGIIDVRRAISLELRKVLGGGRPNRQTVTALGRHYGELDGELAWLYATTFARLAASLTGEQRQALRQMRNGDPDLAAPAYLYADPLPRMPFNMDGTALFFPLNAKAGP